MELRHGFSIKLDLLQLLSDYFAREQVVAPGVSVDKAVCVGGRVVEAKVVGKGHVWAGVAYAWQC
jgi:hypothetical protein